MADLCSLLTATDVTNVLGGGWTEGVMANDYCHWDSNSRDQLALYYQAGDLATFKSGAPGGTDMDVSGHQGYSLSNANSHIFSVWVDIGGGQLLTIEFPTTSDADADQVSGQALAEIAVGNL